MPQDNRGRPAGRAVGFEPMRPRRHHIFQSTRNRTRGNNPGRGEFLGARFLITLGRNLRRIWRAATTPPQVWTDLMNLQIVEDRIRELTRLELKRKRTD